MPILFFPDSHLGSDIILRFDIAADSDTIAMKKLSTGCKTALNMRSYISMDGQNPYIIIGRNPTGLLLAQDDVFELARETVDGRMRFTLVNTLPAA